MYIYHIHTNTHTQTHTHTHRLPSVTGHPFQGSVGRRRRKEIRRRRGCPGRRGYSRRWRRRRRQRPVAWVHQEHGRLAVFRRRRAGSLGFFWLLRLGGLVIDGGEPAVAGGVQAWGGPRGVEGGCGGVPCGVTGGLHKVPCAHLEPR